MIPRRILPVLVAIAVLGVACGGGGGSEATPTPAVTEAPSPTATQPPEPTATAAAVAPRTDPAVEIALPSGFTAYAIAEGFYRATSIAVSADGAIYVSERHGSVYRLRDADGDAVFEEKGVIATGFREVTGLLVGPDGAVYVSSRGGVTVVGPGVAARGIISGLPNGLHQNNGLVFGPDGKLYLTNGSTCDDCVEADERSATILQANPDGTGLRVYARGLRNPYDLVFDSAGDLWATDNGSDAPCATIDELNLIVEGGDYGWPYAADGCDSLADGIPPVANLGLHTASTGIDVYDGEQFPVEYRGNLFLTLWGSLAFEPELPPQLMRAVILPRSGGPGGGPPRAATVETFATGFQHPIDVVVDADGTLLVLDYGAGTLYRIVYTGA